jgi:hypothetical protein
MNEDVENKHDEVKSFPRRMFRSFVHWASYNFILTSKRTSGLSRRSIIRPALSKRAVSVPFVNSNQFR